ncbi:MAG TPA: hypothetical protein VE954_15825 [Oligoflexus sp.]|nr:hypothetical protein [Oligoflexus sp.]HYX34568.1 hypothetical protein [Oligoflexus sp.]
MSHDDFIKALEDFDDQFENNSETDQWRKDADIKDDYSTINW